MAPKTSKANPAIAMTKTTKRVAKTATKAVTAANTHAKVTKPKSKKTKAIQQPVDVEDEEEDSTSADESPDDAVSDVLAGLSIYKRTFTLVAGHGADETAFSVHPDIICKAIPLIGEAIKDINEEDYSKCEIDMNEEFTADQLYLFLNFIYAGTTRIYVYAENPGARTSSEDLVELYYISCKLKAPMITNAIMASIYERREEKTVLNRGLVKRIFDQDGKNNVPKNCGLERFATQWLAVHASTTELNLYTKAKIIEVFELAARSRGGNGKSLWDSRTLREFQDGRAEAEQPRSGLKLRLGRARAHPKLAGVPWQNPANVPIPSVERP
ncbi:hypothetical protein CAC42_1599 [Sphaceloma murrayae]|uniref:BTB domain-containing protein n=1 Tax=Sphaceloma murrayae TaxID=2082308 RepID=A0A2K1R389_9PEZI|nr:hypothetical protein CAC42_1599 [Sphaceloma murrayae]